MTKKVEKKIIFEDDKYLLKVETDDSLIGITTATKGISNVPDATIYLYQSDLEEIQAFVKQVQVQSK